MKGIIASKGIAIGKAYVYSQDEIELDKSNTNDINIEIDKFNSGKDITRIQLTEVIKRATKTLGEEKAAVFHAHLTMLDDPALEESVINKITENKIRVEIALREAIEEISTIFESLDSEYMRERASDVRDVGQRLLYNILGKTIQSLQNLENEVIVIANDLVPSDTATMDTNKVLGFITEVGGQTSHTAIMARTLEIPAIVGCNNCLSMINNNDTIIVDAIKGEMIINPSDDVIDCYKIIKQDLEEDKKKLEAIKELKAITKDGHEVELYANIGTVKDMDKVIKNGAEGIGLYRTEFIYMDGKEFPTEEEQFNHYKTVCEKMEDKEVIIRTLDIGGDKGLPYFQFPEELNPFLGWRAVRMCLDNIDIFKTQIRAVLRASHYGNISFMIPMIISIEEIRQVKEIIKLCKNELKSEGILFNDEIKIGIMIETPSAVMLADKMAKEVDFFSIGTNDLTQYTLAVDRGNESISKLYNSLHPAVLKSIKTVIDASHSAGIKTGMCGELASDERAALILLAMGLDEFSMSASSIPVIKDLIRKVSLADMEKVLGNVLELNTSDEIINYMDNVLENCKKEQVI
ncbi:MAG: phosphoenolpyruvate--protein phosphotransferase [Vallitalea sp.]|jgi:phosphotransferase system enzyme I (PtsI)|nr:phosphoenolpyruvate--protein phosphotransferase [Vallitalea sp.]